MVRNTVVLIMIAVTFMPIAPDLSWAVDNAPFADLAASGDEYLVGPGDILNVYVWKDEALTRTCVVRPDGAFSFPLVGEVRAAERSVSQIKLEMEKKLERFIPGVVMSLGIKQINSMVIYVVGKVNSPGRYFTNTYVDVLQAIAVAGGLNIYAKRNKIVVMRQGEDATTIFPFEYDRFIDGRNLEQNIRLKRGDVVVIP